VGALTCDDFTCAQELVPKETGKDALREKKRQITAYARAKEDEGQVRLSLSLSNVHRYVWQEDLENYDAFGDDERTALQRRYKSPLSLSLSLSLLTPLIRSEIAAAARKAARDSGQETRRVET
jgi:hypothetical protein